MTIEELAVKKKMVEFEITGILAQFFSETGVGVSGAALSVQEQGGIGGGGDGCAATCRIELDF